MAGLRWRPRVVHAAVVADVHAVLDAAGWFATPLPVGTLPVVIRDTAPPDTFKLGTNNLVVVTRGPLTDKEPMEMGPLVSQQMVMYFDIYGESGAVADSIASDIADALYKRTVQLVDPATGLPVDELTSYEQVRGPDEAPVASTATDFRKHWRMVKATATTEFQDSGGL